MDYKEELKEIIAQIDEAKERLAELAEAMNMEGQDTEGLDEALDALDDAIDILEESLDDEDDLV